MSNAKRVMISGYYGFENFGDDLILSVILQHLKSYNAQVLVLSGNPELTEREFGVKAMMRTEVHHIWKAMAHTDFFLSGGGGLFQDATGMGSPIYYGGLIEMANFKRIPVLIFGQGVGPLRSFLGRIITGRAFGHAVLAIVRDVKSQAQVQQLTRQKPELMADPVWLWQPGDKEKRANRQGLGISLRPWPMLDDAAIHHIAKAVIGQPRIRDIGVNLIDCQAGADIVPLSKLEKILKDHGIPCNWYNGPSTALGIASSSAIIGMRYHAILVAAQLGIPAIALSYDPKVQLLAAQLQIADFPMITLLDSLDVGAIQDSWREPNPEVMDQFRRSAARGFSLLKSYLGEGV